MLNPEKQMRRKDITKHDKNKKLSKSDVLSVLWDRNFTPFIWVARAVVFCEHDFRLLLRARSCKGEVFSW